MNTIPMTVGIAATGVAIAAVAFGAWCLWLLRAERSLNRQVNMRRVTLVNDLTRSLRESEHRLHERTKDVDRRDVLIADMAGELPQSGRGPGLRRRASDLGIITLTRSRDTAKT